MQYRRLGRTGLHVSLMGLGTGGPSMFGQKTDVTTAQSRQLVHRALDLGINFFDTSAAYGDSEQRLGQALRGIPRDQYVLATKFVPVPPGSDTLIGPDAVVDSVETSLRHLRVEWVDIMQFHGVAPAQYRAVVETLLPAALRLQEQGKCRFLGISETYSGDPRHQTLPQVLQDDAFDTVMVGYNLLSPGVEALLPACQRQDVGVICMVAVRRALSRPDYLLERLDDAGRRGVIDRGLLPATDPLGWLLKGDVASLPAAAYKYVAAHPAIGTVLTGTSRVSHLEANVRAILGPPLPAADMDRLRRVFARVQEPLGD